MRPTARFTVCRRFRICTQLSAFTLVGCTALPSSEPVDVGDSTVESQQQRDLAQYDDLQLALDAARVRFLPRAVALDAQGDALYWADSSNLFNPTLHRYDDVTGGRVDYSFSIGNGDRPNYRARGGVVVTAAEDAGVTYSAFDANQPNRLLATTVLPSPEDGTHWYAYAVDDGGKVYILQTGGETPLLVWTPAKASPQGPTTLITFGASGERIDDITDFDISGTTMVYLDSGRLWQMDLATKTARWIHSESEVGGSVSFNSDGVLFADSEGLMFLRNSDGKTICVSDAISGSDYRLNETFAHAHAWAGDFTRWKEWVVYVAYSGIFGYHLTTGVVRPILLSPNTGDARIDYREPAVLDSGKMFVVGLTSTSGAVGANGPVYEVDLKGILEIE